MSACLIEIWSACIFIDFEDIKDTLFPISDSQSHTPHSSAHHKNILHLFFIYFHEWLRRRHLSPYLQGRRQRTRDDLWKLLYFCLLYSGSYTQCNRVLSYRLRAFIQLEYHRTEKRVGRLYFHWNEMIMMVSSCLLSISTPCEALNLYTHHIYSLFYIFSSSSVFTEWLSGVKRKDAVHISKDTEFSH